MPTRRRLLRDVALLGAAATAGCSLPAVGASYDPPEASWVPTTDALAGAYGHNFQEHGHVVYRVDAADLRARSDDIPAEMYNTYTKRFAREELPGLRFEEVSLQLIGGVDALNAFPRWLMGPLGRQAYGVTLGDFQRETVVDRLSNQGYDRQGVGEVATFEPEDGVTYAVADGWVVAGFSDFVSTVLAAERGDVGRRVEADDAFDRVLGELGETTFQYAMSHDRVSSGEAQGDRFAGQVAEGVGYEFVESGTELRAVRIFGGGSTPDRSTLAGWADETFTNVDEPDVEIDDDLVRVTGRIDGYELERSTQAFIAFRNGG